MLMLGSGCIFNFLLYAHLRFQEFYEQDERETLLAEILELRNQVWWSLMLNVRFTPR